ncbi:hypothetical protein P3L10_031982 [Capsicum annuum]
MVGRTGRARFRRGPVQVQPQAQNDVKSQVQAHQAQDSLSFGACNGISADRVNAWVQKTKR